MPTSYALLIGVSVYKGNLKQLPSALMDVDKLQEVLVNPGGFPPNNVKVLKNPKTSEMGEEIAGFYKDKSHDDLLLLYYSGHGGKNRDRQLLLSSTESVCDEHGKLQEWSALPARVVRSHMEQCRSKRQVLILDCCYSGAVSKGLGIFKGQNRRIDIERSFDGVGRVILTSSANVEASQASESSKGLSVYTRFLVEGIEKGAADRHQRGWVDAADLHDYTKEKVKQIYREMNPQIFVSGEDIRICNVRSDPTTTFTQAVNKYASIHNGEIPDAANEYLASLGVKLGLSKSIIDEITNLVLQPFKEYKDNLNGYRERLQKLVDGGKKQLQSQDWELLRDSQQMYQLKQSDIEQIHREVGIHIPNGRQSLLIKIRAQKRNILIAIPSALVFFLLLQQKFPFVSIFISNDAQEQPNSCIKEINDKISEGEEILIDEMDINDEVPLKEGAKYVKGCKYKDAVSSFLKSWKNAKYNNPEPLIYLNNAWLASTKKDFYTIAVTISFPYSEDRESNPDDQEERRYKKYFAKEILRGIAQYQTKVNLGLIGNNDSLLEDPHVKEIMDNGFPLKDGINGKGLKVLIMNDGDNTDTAVKQAEMISKPREVLGKSREVLGIIGHYSSKRTLDTVDVFQKNGIAMISPGSTSPLLTENPRSNFFRTVFTGAQQSPFIAKFFRDKLIQKAVVFYDKGTSFSQPFAESFIEVFGEDKNIIHIDNDQNLGQMSNENFNAFIKHLLVASNKYSPLGVLVIPEPLGQRSKNQATSFIAGNASRNWIVGTWGLRTNQTIDKLKSHPESLVKFVLAVPWDRRSDTFQNTNFSKDLDILWTTKDVQPVTATAYDATLVLGTALGMQPDPDRKSVLNSLKKSQFKVEEGATGPIEFGPEGGAKGDRRNPHVEFVHILKCKSSDGYRYFPIALTSPDC